jgi:hypothetical protein
MRHSIGCRRSALLLTLGLLILVGTARAQDKSTPEDRARLVAIAQKLESNPLDETLVAERAWAIKRVIEVSDISVPICSNILGDYFKYKYSSELTAQLTLAGASFVIQNPGESDNKNAIYLASAESTLKAYEAIIGQKPKAKSKVFDELLAIRDSGKLAETVQQRAADGCK